MIRVCAWCDRQMDTNEMPIGERIPAEMQREASHGICLVCADRVRPGWRRVVREAETYGGAAGQS